MTSEGYPVRDTTHDLDLRVDRENIKRQIGPSVWNLFTDVYTSHKVSGSTISLFITPLDWINPSDISERDSFTVSLVPDFLLTLNRSVSLPPSFLHPFPVSLSPSLSSPFFSLFYLPVVLIRTVLVKGLVTLSLSSLHFSLSTHSLDVVVGFLEVLQVRTGLWREGSNKERRGNLSVVSV